MAPSAEQHAQHDIEQAAEHGQHRLDSGLDHHDLLDVQGYIRFQTSPRLLGCYRLVRQLAASSFEATPVQSAEAAASRGDGGSRRGGSRLEVFQSEMDCVEMKQLEERLVCNADVASRCCPAAVCALGVALIEGSLPRPVSLQPH
jgi:hypothetical protein